MPHNLITDCRPTSTFKCRHGLKSHLSAFILVPFNVDFSLYLIDSVIHAASSRLVVGLARVSHDIITNS